MFFILKMLMSVLLVGSVTPESRSLSPAESNDATTKYSFINWLYFIQVLRVDHEEMQKLLERKVCP